MEGPLKISIALCTYNGTRYLPELLKSFLQQDRLADELVVCDDASTDSTREVLQRFAATAPFQVRVHVNDSNIGSTRNFEKAIRHCMGDIVLLCDQDDIWHPTKIGSIEKEFSRSASVGLVFSNAVLIDADSQPLGDELWAHTFPESSRAKADTRAFYTTLWSNNVVTGATAGFRRSFADRILPIPLDVPRVVHDGWTALVVSFLADVVFLDKPLIQYRLHPGQQIGIQPPDMPTAGGIEQFRWTIENLRTQRLLFDAASETFNDSEEIAVRIDSIKRRLDEYIIHLERRIEALENGVGRIPIILRELRTGRYHRFSRGATSALKDLVGSK